MYSIYDNKFRMQSVYKYRTYFVLSLIISQFLTPCECNGINGADTVINSFPSNFYDGTTHSRMRANYRNNDDNHKPIFTECATYTPQIKEEPPSGEFVIQVHADDRDPLENGGTITYTILKREGDRSFFNIDSKTGRITTNLVAEFDRDEPARLKDIYITVQATDNGRPVLADLCTFKVTIMDNNDNAPIFDKYVYEEKVSEDLKVDNEVMRVVASDIDDGDNSRLTFKIKSDGSDSSNEFDKFFRLDPNTGIIYLKEILSQKRSTTFTSMVMVQDNPKNIADRRDSTVSIKITVVGSDKQPPSFVQYPTSVIRIKENYNDYVRPITTLKCQSNIENEEVIFELVKGHTTQTNNDATFVMVQKNDEVAITLGRALDFETVTTYQLTISCTNKDSWSVIKTVDIEIEDVNDEIPQFMELVSGSVLEHELPPAEVMKVRAIDKDGTTANNQVTYELQDHQDIFSIDSKTGKVTTKVELDREKKDVYNVKIVAKDNSESALTGRPYNSASQTFRITVEDINDNPPKFSNSTYTVAPIPENSDLGKEVIEVKAKDVDTASLIYYKIIEGNVDDAFYMENTTGRIKVKNKLDFEKTESYDLIIEANDGLFSDKSIVHIEIANVNDELPQFLDYESKIEIKEETIPADCIVTLHTYDPDIKDRNADQKIVYRVDDKAKDFLHVDESGCVRITKALDRDRPNGYPTHQAFIHAYDDYDSPTSKSNSAELFITLLDINDNAPFLNISEVVWYEHEPAGQIVTLTADDYDDKQNGSPFTYRLTDDADEDIKFKFSVNEDVLYAITEFDREKQKYYYVPISITDSGNPPMTGRSILKVIIGDRNDNRAQYGESQILVYDYRGQSPEMEIGRVYVTDLDDWDLNDKTFHFIDSIEPTQFHLNSDNGMITLRSGTPPGVYNLSFIVTEYFPPDLTNYDVEALVTVTVKSIPEEAVRKSGSIRIDRTSIEGFIERSTASGLSQKEMLRQYLKKILNTSTDNIDVFTVLPVASNDSYVDVRFSAHGSPYYASEKLNSKVSSHATELEDQLGVRLVMIGINECLEETACPNRGSCYNDLQIKDTPAIVFTNKTSFVGVNAVVEAVCDQCAPVYQPDERVTCLNGGIPIDDYSGCRCPDGFDGPTCEILGIGFTANGWAIYPPFQACNKTEIRLEILPEAENGLIFYAGPTGITPLPVNRDFIALELKDGYPRLLLDYGSGTADVLLTYKKLTDGVAHTINIAFQPTEIILSVDDCTGSKCQQLKAPIQPNRLLNVNGPLQLGGTKDNLKQIATSLRWDKIPTGYNYSGCIRNLTVNSMTYNLGQPSDEVNAKPNCNYGVAIAVSFGIDSNFLVAILVCLAILIILLLAVVVHRRKQDNWNEKDADDIRETIISYEDEGGGEVDTGFDLSVLRRMNGMDYVLKEKVPDVPDISGFLDNKKDSCDREANNNPYDDVRYYAYEGDGNSTGSLSSLASCTDDGDLKFNYLSSFGPRFRKLADMYGEDASDEDSHDGGEESWC